MAQHPIDTTAAQYQQLLTGLGVLRQEITWRLPIFRRATQAQRKAWLQRDPLFRQTLLLARSLGPFIEEVADE
jgi:hypothetical protein